MSRLLKKWWPAPLLPISYFAASRLATPDSTCLDQTQLHTVTKEQFKKGHLMNEFVRFIHGKDGDAAGKLEASIVRYKERLPGQLFAPNFVVDLVSVVHIGDTEYYKKLQERLENYDCVIFEGGLAKDATQNSWYFGIQSIREENRQNARRFSLIQKKDCLRQRPSWKHADLDWSTIQNLEEERERRLVMTPLHDRVLAFLQHFGCEFRSLPWPVIAPFPIPFVVYLACSCNDPVLGSVDTLEDILKLGTFSYFAARKFWAAWGASAWWRFNKDYEDTSGLGEQSVLIGERNKVAIKELKGAIKRGEHSIAILYDVSHMPDFHKRLTEEFDLVPTSMDWITAWSVKRGPKSKYIQPFLNKFASEERSLILASLIFATLIAHVLAWHAFGARYWSSLILINFFLLKN